MHLARFFLVVPPKLWTDPDNCRRDNELSISGPKLGIQPYRPLGERVARSIHNFDGTRIEFEFSHAGTKNLNRPGLTGDSIL